MAGTKGLGKGLGALLGDDFLDTAAEAKGTLTLPLSQVESCASQPRKNFDPDALADLADSIAQHGIIQPLTVRRLQSGYYQIIAGERRWRAARLAGLREVPAVVIEADDQKTMELALVENLQRQDLNPIEEAEGLHQMIKIYGMTQQDVSKSVSKSRPYITNALRLLKLPEEIKSYVIEGQLTTGHARALLAVEDPEKQMMLCKKVLEDGLSVRKIEALAKTETKARKNPAKKRKGADTLHVESELKHIFGTKVSIEKKGKKGVIQMEYYSTEELNRLIELLKTVG